VLLYDMPAILQYLCFSLMALYFGKLAISEYTVEQQQRWRTMFNVAWYVAKAELNIRQTSVCEHNFGLYVNLFFSLQRLDAAERFRGAKFTLCMKASSLVLVLGDNDSHQLLCAASAGGKRHFG